MPDNIKVFNKKQEELVEKFINTKLPGRINEIVNVIEQLLNNRIEKELIETLKSISHRLMGVCGTYGLDNLSDVAKRIEKFSRSIGNSINCLSDQQIDTLRNFTSELKKALSCSIEDKSLELQQFDSKYKILKADKNDNIDDKELSKVVFLIEEDDMISRNLMKQFSIYGYKALVVSNINEIIDFIDKETGEIIIMINTSFLNKMEQDIKILASRKRNNTIIAFISDHGDFTMRLKAVKAQADAYFVLPLDVGELIEKLNTFSINSKPNHILIVDDDIDLVAYYAQILQQENMMTSVVSNPLDVVTQIILNKPDLILMDLNMPGCNGWELAKIIRQQEAFVSIPIVFLSSEENVEKQYEALRYGGDDFISKTTPDYELIESIRIRADRYKTLRFYMERDSLTGLLNHTRTIEHLSAEINKAIRKEHKLSFAMIDIDHFKKVNDKYGHMIGDKVLKRLACLLKERLRKSDIIGRYGGEEFSIIFPDTDGEEAFFVLDQIRIKFSEMEHKAPDELFSVTISAGIATLPQKINYLSINEITDYITETADQTLYKAKDKGRNCIELAKLSKSIKFK